MKTINSFSLSKLTDADLSRLLVECGMEQARREECRAIERKRWVDGMYYAFLVHPNATSVQVNNVIVVSVFDRDTGMHMGTARPVHGDEFNREVGVAVAYAKALGMVIPNYI